MRRANEIKPLVKAMVYGRPGSGKTTFAASGHGHDGMGDTFIFDIEDGTLSLAGTDVKLSDVITGTKSLSEEFKKVRRAQGEYAGIGTVVVDSVTRLYRMVMNEVAQMRVDEKGKGKIDKFELQDYDVMTNTCQRILQSIRDLPMHVIFTALAKETSPDATPERPYPKPTDCRPDMPRALCELAQGMVHHVWHMDRADDGTHFMTLHRHGIIAAKTQHRSLLRAIGTKSKSGAIYMTDPSLPTIHDALVRTLKGKSND